MTVFPNSPKRSAYSAETVEISKQRKWSDIFQKIQVDINFILICGTKLRTFKQKMRPQWILL